MNTNELKNLSFKGIILGALADIVGTNIWTILFVIYLISTHVISVQSLQGEGVTAVLSNRPTLFVINVLVGSAFSVIGGYAAAYIAKRGELLNATLSSFLCVGFGITSIVLGTSSFSFSIELLALTLSPLLALLGGYIRLKKLHKA